MTVMAYGRAMMKTLFAAAMGSFLLGGGAGFAAEPQTAPLTSAALPPPSASAIPPWRRPIRIPEGIPLAHAGPPVAIAGGFSTWRVPFELGKDVPPGSVLKLQLWGGRNNKVVHSQPANGQMDLSVSWQDAEPIDKTWMPAAKFCNHPFTFYYVRVTQADGEVAWASPVWIDP